MKSMDFGSTLIVTLISMAIVFFGLAVLIGLIKVMVRVTGLKGKKKTETEEKIVAGIEEPAEDQPVQDDAETVAAIMAAISCMLEEGQQFTVRRIRRIRC